MVSSTTFSSTCPVLSTPPQPQLDSSPTDSSPFAEANQTINELIQAMEHQTNVLDKSESVAPRVTPKSGLVFGGKPLAMALYKQKRKRISRAPNPRSSISRKPRNLVLKRDANGKFTNVKSSPHARPAVASAKDTTLTLAPSEQIMTEPVSPAPPTVEQVYPTPTQDEGAEAVSPSQVCVLDASSPLLSSLSFPMPTAEELASFLYSTYIVPKLTEHQSFNVCREQLYQKYYHAHLISFFHSNLGTTCITFTQIDSMISAALRLLGFD